MRTVLLLLVIQFGLVCSAQERCGSVDYLEAQRLSNPAAARSVLAAETFLKNQSSLFLPQARSGSAEPTAVIKVPVVVHLLYSNASQNLSDEQIKTGIEALNRDYRRRNADTVNTPARFRALAADINIEFYLATAAPGGRATSGIVRKQTQTGTWLSNDKIKFSAQGGDDAWDSKSYLNIWIGNLVSGGGYSSAPGGDPARDGIVVATGAFGTIGRSGNYSMSRVAVHEVGHWLGLKHIWGDAQCGEDGVSDTPKQASFTQGCPTGFRTSCSNGEEGDMYMNYMDYTADACMNLFTQGQKARMLACFAAGGPRQAILQSKGLSEGWVEDGQLPITATKGLVYPNPAGGELYVAAGAGCVGKSLRVYSSNGNLVMTVQATAAVQKVNLSQLKPGMYFIKAESLSEKFIKL